MTDQIVITEKTSQAKDVRAAIGSRYGMVLPAEGHLFVMVFTMVFFQKFDFYEEEV